MEAARLYPEPGSRGWMGRERGVGGEFEATGLDAWHGNANRNPTRGEGEGEGEGEVGLDRLGRKRGRGRMGGMGLYRSCWLWIVCSLPPWPLTSRVTRVVRGWKREFAPQWKSFFRRDGDRGEGKKNFWGREDGRRSTRHFCFCFYFHFLFFPNAGLFLWIFRSLSIPARVSSVYRIVYAAWIGGSIEIWILFISRQFLITEGGRIEICGFNFGEKRKTQLGGNDQFALLRVNWTLMNFKQEILRHRLPTMVMR